MANTEATLERFQKDINVSNVISADGSNVGSPLVRQDLEPMVLKLTDRMTPLRDVVRRTQGQGRAHAWNQRTSLGAISNPLVKAWYADGALPNQSDPQYVQKVAAYKYLGQTAVISGPAIASARSYIDLEAEVAEATVRGVVQAEEWSLFKSSAATNSNAIDGLDVQIVTNTVDKAGAAITDMSDIDLVIKKIRLQGGSPSHIFTSFGMQSIINRLLFSDMRININQGNVVTAGVHVVNYQSPAGVLPVVGDFFINPATPYPYNTSSSSSNNGGPQSNLYVLQVPELEVVNLVGLSRSELAKIADTVRFFVYEYLTFAVKAEVFQGVVKNISDPTS